jgi:hypothetical protein
MVILTVECNEIFGVLITSDMGCACWRSCLVRPGKTNTLVIEKDYDAKVNVIVTYEFTPEEPVPQPEV